MTYILLIKAISFLFFFFTLKRMYKDGLVKVPIAIPTLSHFVSLYMYNSRLVRLSRLVRSAADWKTARRAHFQDPKSVLTNNLLLPANKCRSVQVHADVWSYRTTNKEGFPSNPRCQSVSRLQWFIILVVVKPNPSLMAWNTDTLFLESWTE